MKSTPNTELSSFAAYAVLDEKAVISVTDTFSSAIEAAESYATELAQEQDSTTADLSILAHESEARPKLQGYYGRWMKYDEKEGEAEMEVFFLRVKPDGIILSGSIEERPLARVRVQQTVCDLFDSYLVPYDVESGDEVVSEEGDSADSQEESSSDEESDDATYVDREE